MAPFRKREKPWDFYIWEKWQSQKRVGSFLISKSEVFNNVKENSVLHLQAWLIWSFFIWSNSYLLSISIFHLNLENVLWANWAELFALLDKKLIKKFNWNLSKEIYQWKFFFNLSKWRNSIIWGLIGCEVTIKICFSSFWNFPQILILGNSSNEELSEFSQKISFLLDFTIEGKKKISAFSEVSAQFELQNIKVKSNPLDFNERFFLKILKTEKTNLRSFCWEEKVFCKKKPQNWSILANLPFLLRGKNIKLTQMKTMDFYQFLCTIFQVFNFSKKQRWG